MPKRNSNSTDINEAPDDIRTEYSALSNYFNTVVTFRFTTLGFYLAALALIIGSGATIGKSLLLIIITISLYLMELRNRALYKNLADRGMQIERKYWKYTNEKHYDPFYAHMMKEELPKEDNETIPSKPNEDEAKILGQKVPGSFIRHSWALDILYLGVGLYAMVQLIYLICKFIFIHQIY